MNISAINTTTTGGAAQAATARQKNDEAAKAPAAPAEKAAPAAGVSDSVSISKEALKEVEVARQTGVLQLLGINSDNIGQLRAHIAKVFGDQGMDLKFKADGQDIDLLKITPEDAQKLIGEDGYFGVEKTSQRLADLAIGAAGGDVAKLDVMKKGMEQGFAEAKKAFGDWLPDISYATYDAALKKLDEWAASQQAPAAV